MFIIEQVINSSSTATAFFPLKLFFDELTSLSLKKGRSGLVTKERSKRGLRKNNGFKSPGITEAIQSAGLVLNNWRLLSHLTSKNLVGYLSIIEWQSKIIGRLKIKIG